MLVIVTFGISTIIMHFGVFVEDLLNVITVILQLGFYLSGIFYSIESIGTQVKGKLDPPFCDLLIKLNPIALLITDLRRVLLYGADPHWVMLIAWAFVGLLMSWVGINIIYKFENSYVKVI